MAFLNNVPIPTYDAIVEVTRVLTKPWIDWFTWLQEFLQSVAVRINSVSLDAQQASIAATDFSGASIDAGTYRISYYMRVTTPGSVSSSLQFIADWVDGGVTVTFTGTAITGNTTATYQSASFPIVIDQLSAVRYQIVYADGGGAQQMIYKLWVGIEEIEG